MPVTDDGRPAFMNSRSESLDLSLPGGAVGVGGTSPATQRESYLSGDDGTVPSLAGMTHCVVPLLDLHWSLNLSQVHYTREVGEFQNRWTGKRESS